MATVRCSIVALVAAAGLAAAALAQPGSADKPKDTGAAKPAATQPAKTDKAHKDVPSESGMDAMMEACMLAGQPGKMHEHLARGVGTWDGKIKHWMSADAPADEMTCVSVITSEFDGRFVKNETSGEMPGMGPFHGFGLSGFDNVSQKFQMTWIDNCGTGMMRGDGELAADGKSLTWTLTYHCPMTKKETTMRQVERYTSPTGMTLEMYGPDMKTGKEYKMMEIAYTKRPGTGAEATKKTDAAAPKAPATPAHAAPAPAKK